MIDTIDFGVLSAVNEVGLEVAYVSFGYTNFLCLCGISNNYFIWLQSYVAQCGEKQCQRVILPFKMILNNRGLDEADP